MFIHKIFKWSNVNIIGPGFTWNHLKLLNKIYFNISFLQNWKKINWPKLKVECPFVRMFNPKLCILSTWPLELTYPEFLVIYQFYDSKLKNNNPLCFKIWKKVGSKLAASSTSHHEENKDYFSQVHKYYTYR